MLLRKVAAHQSANFQTCHWSHLNSPNFKSQFFIKLWTFFSVMKHKIFCIFSSKSLYALAKRIQLKCKFSDFCLLARKLAKFLMSFFKPQVGFHLNFALPFSVMTHNPSEIFQLKHISFGQKEPINIQFFRFLSAVMKVHPIPHAIFQITRSGFIQILHHCSVS